MVCVPFDNDVLASDFDLLAGEAICSSKLNCAAGDRVLDLELVQDVMNRKGWRIRVNRIYVSACLLYTSDAADE